MDFHVVLIIVSSLGCVYTETIKEVIAKRPQFTEIRQRLENLNFYNDLNKNPISYTGAAQKYTFFAAENSAFQKLSQTERSRFRNLNANDRKLLFRYHTVESESAITESNLIKEKARASLDGEKLFFHQYESSVFVNGARIADSIECGNGMIHVIDSILLTSKPNTRSIYDFLFNGPSQSQFTEFRKMLNTHGKINAPLKNKDGLTLFAPSNNAFQRLPARQRELLTTNEDLAKKVVSAHIINNDAVFTSYFKLGEKFDSLMYNGKSVKIHGFTSGKSFFVVSNETSVQVLTPNITLQNGVVHITNKLFYQYNTAFGQIEEVNDLRSMEIAVNNAYKVNGGKVIKDTLTNPASIVTVFSPTDTAFSNIQGNSQSQNVTRMVEVLKMCIIAGKRLSLAELTDGREETSMGGKKMRFFRETDENGNTEVYVESGFIRARIIEPDVGVLNGVLHYIDQVFGITYRNMFQEIQGNPDLYQVKQKIDQLKFNDVINLNSNVGTMTFFAPNNSAWTTLFDSIKGKSIENALLNYNSVVRDEKTDFMRVWTNVLKRHVVKGRSLYAGELTPTVYDLDSENGRIVLFEENGEWYVKFTMYGGEVIKAKVFRKDIGVNNGVIHIIDTVLADINPGDPSIGDWTSTASYIRTSLWLTFLIVTLFMSIFR